MTYQSWFVLKPAAFTIATLLGASRELTHNSFRQNRFIEHQDVLKSRSAKSGLLASHSRGCGRRSCCCRYLKVGKIPVVPIVLSVAVDVAGGQSVRNMFVLHG